MSDSNYHVISRGATTETDGEYFNEAPYVFRANGYRPPLCHWYACCAGSCKMYEIRMGRSTSPTGPLEDKDGVEWISRMSKRSTVRAQRGSLCCKFDQHRILDSVMRVFYFFWKHVFSFHFYDFNDNGAAKLGMRVMTFDSDQWPVLSDEDVREFLQERDRTHLPKDSAVKGVPLIVFGYFCICCCSSSIIVSVII